MAAAGWRLIQQHKRAYLCKNSHRCVCVRIRRLIGPCSIHNAKACACGAFYLFFFPFLVASLAAATAFSRSGLVSTWTWPCPDWPPCHAHTAMRLPFELLGEERAVKSSKRSLWRRNVSHLFGPAHHSLLEAGGIMWFAGYCDFLASAATKSSKFERHASRQAYQNQRESLGHHLWTSQWVETLEVAICLDCDLSSCISLEALLKPPSFPRPVVLQTWGARSGANMAQAFSQLLVPRRLAWVG